MDPRISVAWCKRNEVPIEKMGIVERLLQNEFIELNVKYDAGTEFYNKKIPTSSKDMREEAEKIISNNHVIYGINTGFGSLSSITIDADKLGDLQSNLIRSHACGVGEKMENNHVLMMMLVRANSLAKGYSGTRIEVIELLFGKFS